MGMGVIYIYIQYSTHRLSDRSDDCMVARPVAADFDREMAMVMVAAAVAALPPCAKRIIIITIGSTGSGVVEEPAGDAGGTEAEMCEAFDADDAVPADEGQPEEDVRIVEDGPTEIGHQPELTEPDQRRRRRIVAAVPVPIGAIGQSLEEAQEGGRASDCPKVPTLESNVEVDFEHDALERVPPPDQVVEHADARVRRDGQPGEAHVAGNH